MIPQDAEVFVALEPVNKRLDRGRFQLPEPMDEGRVTEMSEGELEALLVVWSPDVVSHPVRGRRRSVGDAGGPHRVRHAIDLASLILQSTTELEAPDAAE